VVEIESTEITPKLRATVDKYTSAAIIGVSSFAFMTAISLLPGAPVFPLLVSILLFAVALYRGPRLSSTILSLIVFVTIFYQLTGFSVWTARSNAGLAFIIISVAALIVNLLSARLEATSMAIAILAVSVMFTPYYYLSVPLIVAAAVIGGLSSIGPVSLTYILTMLPLLVIENAFISGMGSQLTRIPPLIFTQLINFSKYMRPPLPGLNIFLTYVPSDFYDPIVAAPVYNYLSNGMVFYLLIPIIILAIVFSLSAGVASIINGMLDRLSVFENTSQLLKLISPLVASIVTPLTFYVLITMLSQPNIGGYQTSLDTLTMIWMTASSLVLGTVFTGREYGIQWLERAEKARIKVSQNIDVIKDLLDASKELISRATSDAPSINLSPEAKTVEETESTINDFRRGLSTASYETLNEWIEELDKVLTPRTKSLPEALRVRVMGELTYLVSLVVTYNNILMEVGLKKSFSESAEAYGDLEFNQALKDYSKLLNDVKTNSNDIFNMYKDTFNAFNTLTSQLDVRPPVDPTRLFESNDYEGGIKLLAEEYWLGFHVKNQSELESLVASLSAKIEGLTLLLDEQTGQKLRLMNEKLARSKPVDSLLILEEVKNLKQIIDGVLNDVSGEITQIQKLVDSFPGTTKVIPFEVYNYSARLQSLKLRNLNAKTTIRDSISVVEELTEFLKYYGDSKKADESNLIVISQLPVAMKIIKNELASKKTIEISSLPFQRRAAQIYAAYYVNNNPETRYDEEKEVIGTHA
jgi:hypothetical protein